MKKNVIVSLADSNYFPLLNELIDSIKSFKESQNTAICVLDAGLTEEQRINLSKKVDEIKNYKLIFDMKFREDYEGDFLGVCVGPSWKDFGPGEFSIILNNRNNFKNSIVGKFLEDNDDGCDIYHYYVRFFEVETLDQTVFLIGVATDYAKEYPDAPYIWKQNKNNDLEVIGTSNIEKYSLNFELSK